MKTTRRFGGLLIPAVLAVQVSGCASAPAEPAGAVEPRAGKLPAAQGEAVQPARAKRTAVTVLEARQSQPQPAAAASDSSAQLFPGTGEFIASASTGAQTAGEERDLTLNFEGADIREVTRTILGDFLQSNYSIDDKVTGQVYLQTTSPVGRGDLIPILESILRTKGAALIKAGDLYRVVPEAEALKEGVMPAVHLSPGQGYQLLIVPLRYISAQEMKKVLDPLMGDKSTVQVDAQRNLLFITGSQSKLSHLVATVELFDVDQFKGMSVGMFRLNSVAAKTVVKELEQIFGDTEGGPLTGMVRFVPVERLNALLVVTPQQKYLQDVRLWIERLDRLDVNSGTNLYVYHVENRNAKYMADMLDRLFVGAAKRDAARTPAEPPKPREPVAEGAAAPRPAGFTGATGGVSADAGGISIIADDENNALLIQATPEDYAKIEKAIRQLDILPMQVLVEASIIEVSLSDELSFGLEWFFKNNKLLDNKTGIGSLDLGAKGIAPITPGFSYALVDSNNLVHAVLNTLASESKVRVISSPSLLVLDNKTASIRVGDQVPVRTSETTSVATSGAAPLIVSTIQFKDTGVLLEVTPRVNAGGTVIMDIGQEVSDVSRTTTSGIDSPTINQRQIRTTVAVQSAETIVLGGLIRDNNADSESGVPGVKDVPGVGWLFQNESKTKERTELLVLITPTAIANESEARAATEELKQKMKGLKLPSVDAEVLGGGA